MNTPNPLHPKGAFPDSQGRSHIRIAVFSILAIHVVLLGALLLQGCKRTSTEPEPPDDSALSIPPFEATSNVFTPPPEVVTFTPPPPITPVVPPTSNPPVLTPPAPPPEIVPPVTPPEVAPPPIVTPPTEFVPPAPDRKHVVVKGDSFYSLAKQYGVTMKAIGNANTGVDPRRLKIGQKLVIPTAVEVPTTPGSTSVDTGTTYVVISGDTLTRIARKQGTTIKALRKENNLRTDRLKVGQKLKIPESGTATGN